MVLLIGERTIQMKAVGVSRQPLFLLGWYRESRYVMSHKFLGAVPGAIPDLPQGLP
jgi:hypothetical protein